MRQLHPVSFHEKFVASGTYVLTRNGVPTGEVERWTMHEPGPGSLTIRSDRQGREGRDWIFEGLWIGDAHSVRSGHIARFDVQVLGQNQQTHARFVFSPGELQFSARVGAATQPIQMLLLPPNTQVRPPSLVVEYRFALNAIGELPVYAPGLDAAEGTIAVGHVHLWHVEPAGEAEEMIEGQRYPVRRFHLIDEMKNRHAAVAFDSHDVLVQLERGPDRVVLTNYVRRPEPVQP